MPVCQFLENVAGGRHRQRAPDPQPTFRVVAMFGDIVQDEAPPRFDRAAEPHLDPPGRGIGGDPKLFQQVAEVDFGQGAVQDQAHRAFIGMGAFVNGDVPPFVMVAQDGYGRPRGINAEGLKRRGFDASRTSAIKRAYRALYMGGGSLEEARAKLADLAADSADVRAFLDFVEAGQRPLLR